MSTLEQSFIAALRRVEQRGDLGTLARLRRGVGKRVGFAPDRDGWVRARLPDSASDELWRACALVASLFALHSTAGGAGSLGAACARLRDRLGNGSADRRFVALVESDAEDLPGRLRHAITLLKSKDVPVDWERLLSDVQRWGHPDRFVQRAWTRDYWAGTEVAESESVGPTEK